MSLRESPLTTRFNENNVFPLFYNKGEIADAIDEENVGELSLHYCALAVEELTGVKLGLLQVTHEKVLEAVDSFREKISNGVSGGDLDTSSLKSAIDSSPFASDIEKPKLILDEESKSRMNPINYPLLSTLGWYNIKQEMPFYESVSSVAYRSYVLDCLFEGQRFSHYHLNNYEYLVIHQGGVGFADSAGIIEVHTKSSTSLVIDMSPTVIDNYDFGYGKNFLDLYFRYPVSITAIAKEKELQRISLKFAVHSENTIMKGSLYFVTNKGITLEIDSMIPKA